MTNENPDDEETRPHIDYHQVGSQEIVYKRTITPKHAVLLFFMIFVPVILFSLFEFTGYAHHDEPFVGAEDLSRCTFDDLHNAFHPPTKRYKTYSPLADTTQNFTSQPQCWSLEQEVLRVPAEAIHRHHLIRLGNGYRGAVYKAIVELPVAKGSPPERCHVALKTDHCNTLKSGIRTKQTGHSCIEPRSFSLNKDSYMAGEYAGAAMYYALRHMKEQDDPQGTAGDSFARRAERGLLPTWGLVQDFGHPIRASHKRSDLKGYPHPDGTVKGIIMPLVDFEPLSSLSPDSERSLLNDASTIARALLSAAEGLQLVGGMRLSYRDVAGKNIGLIVDSDDDGESSLRTIIFDNSYVSVEDGRSCMLPDNQNQGCNYCDDNVMFHTEAREDGVHTDLVAFRGILVDLLKRSPDSSEEKNAFMNKLDQCETIQEIVDVLRVGP